MTSEDVPKEIWLSKTSYGVVCYFNDGQTKYTRLSPDDIVISREELEAFIIPDSTTMDLFIQGYDTGWNNLIDKLLERE